MCSSPSAMARAATLVNECPECDSAPAGSGMEVGLSITQQKMMPHLLLNPSCINQGVTATRRRPAGAECSVTASSKAAARLGTREQLCPLPGGHAGSKQLRMHAKSADLEHVQSCHQSSCSTPGSQQPWEHPTLPSGLEGSSSSARRMRTCDAGAQAQPQHTAASR